MVILGGSDLFVNPPAAAGWGGVMTINAAGWLTGVRRRESPNCNDRPAGEVSLIVIHGISLPPGEFGGAEIDAFFTNTLDCTAHPYFARLQGVEVSSHLLIRRDGELVQYVPFSKRAWHAGQSCFEGREACNDFSIGIELEGTDELPYTDQQYRALNAVVSRLQAHYPQITAERIVGHADIAPGRKTDPGKAFDWSRVEAVAGARQYTSS